jgi:glycosyltransferase involved in cell wall biosynthesis
MNQDKNQMQTLVSIGMGVYNGENYIRQALDSLLEQDYHNFEIIISDNASTDATGEIAKEYAESDARVKYFRQTENISPEKNWKFVFDSAMGVYYMGISHDDMRDANWLSTLLAEFKEGDIGVIGDIRFLRDDGVYIRHLKSYSKGSQLTFFMDNECNYRNLYVFALFRRDLLLKADYGPMYLDYCPDYVYVYSLLRLGNLRATRKTLMSFRVHSLNDGLRYSRPWKGWKKIVYRIHPLRYYLYHLQYTDGNLNKILFILLIPFKHIYAQASFWFRGARELLTGRRFI